MRKINPFKLLVLGYIGIILLGALLLLLPLSRRGPLSPIDALFTATSAVCVTGLIVKDTATFFTAFGKGVLLLLIQIGGLGYMTFATLILFILGKKGSLALRMTMAESFPELTIGNVYNFSKRIAIYAFSMEAAGAALLYAGFSKYGIENSFGHALFNSVSAFCNAGFSTFSDSLSRFRGDPLVVLPVMFLFITGGLGFFVLDDLERRFLKRSERRLLLHTKVVLLSTISLIIAGAVFLFIYEYRGGFSNYGLSEKVLAALFQATTPRTAGFSTVDIGKLAPASLLLIIFLMVVGGSPGGTAGGVKTTALSGLLIWIKAYLSGKEEAHFMGRKLSEDTIKRIFSVWTLAATTLFISSFVVALSESSGLKSYGFLPYFFEVASAFGTVGLSTGSHIQAYVSLARDFSTVGKGVIIITMLTGRVGVLSMAAFLVRKKRDYISHIEGKFIVG
ncbi:MAG: hypothetical protein J7L74_00295 [Candidatus Hydrothermae bacterium]|nr:hypothetical protein [Candidatus Hydrothermae bacterium]